MVPDIPPVISLFHIPASDLDNYHYGDYYLAMKHIRLLVFSVLTALLVFAAAERPAVARNGNACLQAEEACETPCDNAQVACVAACNGDQACMNNCGAIDIQCITPCVDTYFCCMCSPGDNGCLAHWCVGGE